MKAKCKDPGQAADLLYLMAETIYEGNQIKGIKAGKSAVFLHGKRE